MSDVSLTKQQSSEHNLPIIKCEWGHEILLLPDLHIMAQVIEAHVLEHRKKNGLTQEETEIIRENLIVQAFELAIKC